MPRKRQKTADGEEVSAAERLRRQKQRELQNLAIQARCGGKEYKAHKCKHVVYRDVNASVTPRPSQAHKPEAHAANPEMTCFQVVILPIFWNQRPSEKIAVLKVCEQAAESLDAAGISSHVDKTNQFTPGKRMRHWEEKGVKVRLEIGPKEAEQKICIIARSQRTAGQVAHKVPGDIGAALGAQVRGLLDIPDHKVPAGDMSKYGAAKTQEHGSNGCRVEAEDKDIAHRQAARPAPEWLVPQVVEQTSAPAAGDDLTDDFEGEVEVGDDDVALTQADKRRKVKRLKADKKRRQMRAGM